MSIFSASPFLLLSLLFLGACALPLSEAREADLLATIDALSTENAALLGQAAGTPSPNGGKATPTPANGAPVASPQEGKEEAGAISRLPRVISTVQLAAEGETLRDFRRDAAANRLYVTDSKFRLHILDGADGSLLQTVQGTGDMLVLDEAHGRLYLMPSYDVYFSGPAVISIFDTRSQTLLEKTLLGSRVSVDSVGNRLYVGDLYTYMPDGSRAPLRLLDGDTFEELARSERIGTPLYNPANDEVILTAYSAYTLDPQTLAVRADLFPAISAQQIPGCNGCNAIRNTYLFPPEGLLAFEQMVISAGKGPGVYPPPIFKDAATLETVQTPAQFAITCSSQPLLRQPWQERIYEHIFYSRYVTFNNLVVNDLAGAQLALRDGLSQPFVNPQPGVAYINDAFAGTFVLDLETLLPLAYLQPLCLIERAQAGGLLFAFGDQGRSLLVLEEEGGQPELTPPQPVVTEGAAIRAIYVSPDYAADQSIFLDVSEPVADYSSTSALYRSTDGGGSWVRLTGGGLPSGADLTYSVALSPIFGEDRTLLVGGHRRDFAGIGVWRSTDAGDTWQAAWDGLEALRVSQVLFSPNYAQDGIAVAYARFQEIEPWASGSSLYQSSDGGQSWTLKTIANDPNTLPSVDVVLPSATLTPRLPVRKASFSDPIEYTVDGGETWLPAVGKPGVDAFLVTFLSAPDFPQNPTLYAVLEAALLRSLDGGRTWQSWDDARLIGRTYNNYLSAAAVTPPLADGSYRLLIGTLAGEFWQLDPRQLTWTPAIKPTGLLGDPPVGFYRPQGPLGGQWQGDLALQEELGWALTQEQQQTPAAIQPFEHGVMVWRGDNRRIYVLLDSLTWQVYEDTFGEDDVDSDPAARPPGGLLQPVRGFGKVWRDSPGLREQIGWGASIEKAVVASLQEYEHGVMLFVEGQFFTLIDAAQGRVWR